MSKPRWIRTRDRRPKPGREIVGWYGKDVGYLVVERDEDDGRYYDDTGGEWDAPVLWIKLKKLPKSAADDARVGEALRLLRRLADEDPWVESYTGDVSCHHCHAGNHGDKAHEPDCPWVAAKRLTEDAR